MSTPTETQPPLDTNPMGVARALLRPPSLILLAVVLGLASCSAEESQSERRGLQTEAEVLEREFAFAYPEYIDATTRCMEEEGFDYNEGVASGHDATSDDATLNVAGLLYIPALLDESQIKADGYGYVDFTIGSFAAVTQSNQPSGVSPESQAEYDVALFGSFDGNAPGCLQKAAAAYPAFGAYLDFLSDLEAERDNIAAELTATVSFDGWSRCMSERGFHFVDVRGPADYLQEAATLVLEEEAIVVGDVTVADLADPSDIIVSGDSTRAYQELIELEMEVAEADLACGSDLRREAESILDRLAQ